MADLRKGINLPPSVTLLTPEAEKLAKNGRLRLEIVANDTASGATRTHYIAGNAWQTGNALGGCPRVIQPEAASRGCVKPVSATR